MKVPISEHERLKLDAPVLGAIERFRGGRRRFWVYCPHCKSSTSTDLSKVAEALRSGAVRLRNNSPDHFLALEPAWSSSEPATGDTTALRRGRRPSAVLSCYHMEHYSIATSARILREESAT